jgi:S-adenosylmethionine:tRNA ribosyltransferase-isomerase
MQVDTIKIQTYDYELPEDRIPKYPLEKRDQSKLLVYKNGEITDQAFENIQQFLPKECHLIFNDSKVLPVRFYFKTPKEKKIEIFCLESIQETECSATWKCFVGNARAWKEGNLSNKSNEQEIEVELLAKEKDYCIVTFYWNSAIEGMEQVFDIFGEIPIPPYLNRKSEELDIIRYQNVFAHHNGSVAAPTAGLHFTKHIIKELKEQQFDIDFVTLHVGVGTFKPVKSETVNEHEMHKEQMVVTKDIVEKLIQSVTTGKKITAVGTTTLRTLESMYWLGTLLVKQPNLQEQDLKVKQWQPYQYEQPVDTLASLQSILNWLNSNNKTLLPFATELLILPSYQFKLIDCLITNFHQPKSTLLLLVAAAVGEDWKKIYQHALANEYRFLSYGDSSLLYLNK